MVAEVIKHFGTIDILVNNAGVFRTVPVAETTEAIWDEQLDLNLRGAFFCVKAVLPEFQQERRRQGDQHHLDRRRRRVSELPGLLRFQRRPGNFDQGARGRTRASKTSTSTRLAPGNVATPLNAHLRGPGNEDYINLMRTMTPTGRDFLSVEEMTGAAVFLASDDASAIHGATLMVDAGWSAIW